MALKKPITIENWSSGIGASPHVGFQEIYNCDVFNVDGTIKPNFQLLNQIDTPVTGITFTGGSSTSSQLTLSASIARNIPGSVSGGGRAIVFGSSGTLPAPLVSGTVYYAIDISGGTTIQVASTLDNALLGTAITLTSNASGPASMATIDPWLMTNFAYSPANNSTYAVDSRGFVWQASLGGDLIGITGVWFLITGTGWSGLAPTNASGNGIAVWKNYLFVFRNQYIDVYGDLSTARSTRAWSTNWKQLYQAAGDQAEHPTWVASNYYLYWGDYNSGSVLAGSVVNNTPYVGYIYETPGSIFAPGTPASYSFVPSGLRLPQYDRLTSITELNTLLAIGGSEDKLYFWDEISPTYDFIFIPEIGVHSLLNINNILYIACGNKGNIYLTYGTYAQKILDFSDYLSGFPQYFVTTVDMVKCQGRIFFALTGDILSAGTSPDDQISGIYSLNLVSTAGSSLDSTQGAGYTMEYVTNGGYGATLGGLITDSTGTWITVGWYNSVAGTYGVDSYYNSVYVPGIKAPQRATGYIAQVVSPMYVIGSALEPETAEIFEINLAEPLATGQGAQISFRANSSDTWSTPMTLDYSSPDWLGSIKLFGKINIQKMTFLQANLQLTSAGASSGPVYDTIKVRNVVLR